MNDFKYICYLCGKEITDDNDFDVLPNKDMYGDILSEENAQDVLIYLTVHCKCLNSYKTDENIFTSFLLSITEKSSYKCDYWCEPTDATRKKHENQRPFFGKLDKKTDITKDIPIPEKKLLIIYNRQKMSQIIWKICRGVYFHEFNKFIPEDCEHRIIIFFPGDPIDSICDFIIKEPSRCMNDIIFDYKYIVCKNEVLFALLFFSTTIALVSITLPEQKGT